MNWGQTLVTILVTVSAVVGLVWTIMKDFFQKQENLLKEQIEALKNQLPKATELESKVNIIEKLYEKEIKALKEKFESFLDQSLPYMEKDVAEKEKRNEILRGFLKEAKDLSPEETKKLAADYFCKLVKLIMEG